MKFGYDTDGRLVAIEDIELAAKIEELDAQLNARPLSSRGEDVARIRSALQADGQAISEQDEEVLSLYREGVLDFHNVDHHFGQRLVKALLRREAGTNDAA